MMSSYRRDVDDVSSITLQHAWGEQPGDNCHGSDVGVHHLPQLLQTAPTMSAPKVNLTLSVQMHNLLELCVV